MIPNEFLVKYPLLYQKTGPRAGFWIEKGWYSIVETLSAKIEEVNRGLKLEEVIVCNQVKEKMGILVFHIGNVPDRWKIQINEWILDAVKQCANTCEFCGKIGERWLIDHTWKTICNECLDIKCSFQL